MRKGGGFNPLTPFGFPPVPKRNLRGIISKNLAKPCNQLNFASVGRWDTKGDTMKKTALILATVAAIGAAAVTTAPAEARGRGWGGPAIGLGIAAGALAAGAYGAYGPGYGYYGPRYYRPRYYGYGYGPGPYAYY